MITRNLLTRSYKLLLTLLVLLMSTNAFAQRLTATGKVTDATGLEVIGASVLEKGTANGVVTNLDGEFSLSVGQNATLVISFIGYKTIEVKATTNMNITLQEDNELLDEVVAMIASLAATEVEGVSAMAGNITNELIGKVGVKSLSKGVKVQVAGNTVKADLALCLEYGYNIPETCSKVQEKVKNAIENMTGLTVTDVNIRIVNVNMEPGN